MKQLTTELILEPCPYNISLEITSENAFRKAGHLFPFVLRWQVWRLQEMQRHVKNTDSQVRPGISPVHCLLPG